MNDDTNTNDCKDIPLWIETINTKPDMLHLDYTPSVYKLSECGLAAAIAILPLLESEDIWERYRAQRVLEGTVQRRFGWQPGHGYPPESNGEDKMKNLWREMGMFQADASKEKRRTSIDKWKHWLETQIQEDEKK